jgi:hypothetical protein|tara:strand:+ start:1382 stop:1624 length:243 start_codon:yes stop_codon:yes gene_type:complete
MIKDGSFVKHTIGETLEAGWLVQIKRPGEFHPSELGHGGSPYMGIVLKRDDNGASKYWRILLPNGKKPIVMPDEVDLIAG